MSEEKKVFKGIPLVSAELEGNTLHLRNDGDAPALVKGAVFGYRDEAGNFVAQEHAIHSVEIEPLCECPDPGPRPTPFTLHLRNDGDAFELAVLEPRWIGREAKMSEDDQIRDRLRDVRKVLGALEHLSHEKKVRVLQDVLEKLGIEPGELEDSDGSVG